MCIYIFICVCVLRCYAPKVVCVCSGPFIGFGLWICALTRGLAKLGRLRVRCGSRLPSSSELLGLGFRSLGFWVDTFGFRVEGFRVLGRPAVLWSFPAGCESPGCKMGCWVSFRKTQYVEEGYPLASRTHKQDAADTQIHLRTCAQRYPY